MKYSLLFAALLAAGAAFTASSTPCSAQIGLGADLYSRYVWRGADFGDSFSIQPALSYAKAGFEIGAWSSYSISADGAGADELDLYVSYTRGPLTVGVTDYHFPQGAELFNFENDGQGAHFVEPFVSFSGPVDLYAGLFAYNDPAHSLYLQASKSFDVEGTELTLTIGGTPSGSDEDPSLYGTSGPALLVLGIGASKEVPLTSTFSLPMGVSYIINPYDERGFLIFSISL